MPTLARITNPQTKGGIFVAMTMAAAFFAIVLRNFHPAYAGAVSLVVGIVFATLSYRQGNKVYRQFNREAPFVTLPFGMFVLFSPFKFGAGSSIIAFACMVLISVSGYLIALKFLNRGTANLSRALRKPADPE